jgi:hypothetical protein
VGGIEFLISLIRLILKTAINKLIKLVVIITGTVFVLGNCKKNPFDYRNKYKGDFLFTEYYHSYIYYLPQPNPPRDSFITYQYDVNIDVNYSKEFKGKLILKTDYNYTQTIQVDKKGNILLDCPYQGTGKFNNNNNLNYTETYNIDCPGAGLGGGYGQSSHTITATRK